MKRLTINKILGVRYLFIDLLCIVHRDGGHHIEKVGLEQAVEDAKNVYYKLRQENEELREVMQRFCGQGGQRRGKKYKDIQ